MQGVIRSSEQRVRKERTQGEAARLRACKNNVGLLALGVFLLAAFALTNIVLLKDVLNHAPTGAAGAGGEKPWIGPLLRERMRRKGTGPTGNRLRAAFNGTIGAVGRKFKRVATWARGKRPDSVQKSTQPLNHAAMERQRFQELHQVLKDRGRGASRGGNATQALKEHLGLAPASGNVAKAVVEDTAESSGGDPDGLAGEGAQQMDASAEGSGSGGGAASGGTSGGLEAAEGGDAGLTQEPAAPDEEAQTDVPAAAAAATAEGAEGAAVGSEGAAR